METKPGRGAHPPTPTTTIMMTKPNTKPRIGRINRQRLRARNMELRFGTWNARSLRGTGDLKSLIQEMNKYRLQLLAIQETRWKNSGETKHGDYTFFYSGGKQSVLGVAFAIHKSLLQNVIEFRPVNERMCAIRIKTKFFNIRIINVHAEHENREIDAKDAFYQQLEREYDKSPSNDIRMIMGDLNAKIGKEGGYRPVIGKESLHLQSNDNGIRVIDFATSRNMVVSSTYFQRKDIYKYTWISPDGKTRNQIDHVLIDKRGASCIMQVRTYRGADCNSDHHLVGVVFRCRLSTQLSLKVEKCKKFDVEKLKDDKILETYQRMLERNQSALLSHPQEAESDDINATWNKIKTTISSAAENSIGFKQKRKVKDWFDEECKEAIKKRQELHLAYVKNGNRCTRSQLLQYKQARRTAKKICQKKKREHMNAHIIRMQQNFLENNPRKAYKEINFFNKGYKPPVNICRDASGKIVVGKTEVQRRWKEFFEQLLNDRKTNGRELDPRLENPSPSKEDDPPTLQEVSNILRTLKNNKAPGKDNLPAELFKYGGDILEQSMHQLIKQIWSKEEIPKEWEESIICPIYKKGDKFECKNHRGISLLNSAYKILTSIIKNRMEPYAEKVIGDYQAGFRRNRSTMDQLFTVREILRKSWEYNVDVYQLFIDFRQAYDSIDRELLYSTMLNLGIPPKLVRLTKATMSSSRCSVKIQGQLGEEFNVRQGLKQGDGLAPMLFNLALEGVIRKIDKNAINGHLGYKSNQLTGYADDINCLARSLLDLKEIFLELERAAKEIGLMVNEDKTKVLLQSRKERVRLGQNVSIGEYNFEKVDEFKYLGSVLTTDNNETADVRERIKAANRAYFSVIPVMKSRDVHKKTKLMLYKTLIRTVATYGCEAWTLTTKSEEMLNTFERKILRRIYGPVTEYDPVNKVEYKRIRYNHELYQIYKAPPLSKHVKIMRLRWAGHVQRMNDNRITKKVIDATFNRNRPTGRPRARWENNIENDAKELLKVEHWKSAAEDRNDWRTRLKEAVARYEL